MGFILQIIEQRRKYLKKKNDADDGGKDGKDESKLILKPFIDNLLKATLDGKPMNNHDIFEELSTFIYTVRTIAYD